MSMIRSQGSGQEALSQDAICAGVHVRVCVNGQVDASMYEDLRVSYCRTCLRVHAVTHC